MKASRYEKFSIQSDVAVVGINPEGGYVSGWKVKNPGTEQYEDVLYQGSSQKRSGIPILFPQFSAAKDMRSHGFGRDSLWTVNSVEKDLARMVLRSDDLADDVIREYPYPFEAVIEVNIAEERALAYTFTVKNKGTSDMPISPGIHPYWKLPHEAKKDIQIEGVHGFNAAGFDWDKAPPDNPYDYVGKTSVIFPDRKIVIEDISVPKAIKHIVVWSQTPANEDYHFVCVEPICGYINALDTSPILVPPKSKWIMKVQFSVQFTSTFLS